MPPVERTADALGRGGRAAVIEVEVEGDVAAGAALADGDRLERARRARAGLAQHGIAYGCLLVCPTLCYATLWAGLRRVAGEHRRAIGLRLVDHRVEGAGGGVPCGDAWRKEQEEISQRETGTKMVCQACDLQLNIGDSVYLNIK